MLMIPSLISLTISPYTPQRVYCEIYSLLKGNTVEFNFNIPHLRMICCAVQCSAYTHPTIFYLNSSVLCNVLLTIFHSNSTVLCSVLLTLTPWCRVRSCPGLVLTGQTLHLSSSTPQSTCLLTHNLQHIFLQSTTYSSNPLSTCLLPLHNEQCLFKLHQPSIFFHSTAYPYSSTPQLTCLLTHN